MNKSQWAQKVISVALVCAIFIAGCGGHAANPIPPNQPGDQNRSCTALRAQMSQIDQDIIVKNKEKDTRDFWNIVEFGTGFLVLVPWFFMDVKGSHEVEIAAFKARKNNLAILYEEKNCDAPAATTGTTN
jgi:hypothetical protein